MVKPALLSLLIAGSSAFAPIATQHQRAASVSVFAEDDKEAPAEPVQEIEVDTAAIFNAEEELLGGAAAVAVAEDPAPAEPKPVKQAETASFVGVSSVDPAPMNPEYEYEFSKAIPFLVRPDKLDGSMPGDMGFDPMRLSDIQVDLRYARWAEIKHGRICMLAIVGMVVQQSGIHWPGDTFTNTDVFGAIKSVGWSTNLGIFLTIGTIEGVNFYKHYDDTTIPGNLGWGSNVLLELSPKDQLWRQEQEIVHGRLAMIAFVGAIIQTLLFDQPLLSLPQ